ncbi:glycosyltransferase [Pseudomonas sp. DTU_2021_1001937_2_SI_NGA_ILE_001]|uniref:glycosyltransferase n=1 Tax=Pseudomonas sp. DTU_2021_1001937_2_SI_NGA_ILE_001 TaxID=3077589 RepID=UPI0028FC221F|nr:glycosyltransferase [Pseudomonas sp. DTU_2021_1001937_2_SI_NGA_ILE_001]WNW10727.1 glycosyltransferase [Pseudomonas sp. DTU_2021_1001937_2_SI_NGA_ILE_001]
MSHFAVVAPAYYSHFQAFQALAVELIERGHRVTFFQQADARVWLSDARIGFHALGRSTHGPGCLADSLRRAGQPCHPLGLKRLIDQLVSSTAMLCAELPAALARQGIDAVLCDEMEAAGALVAEASGLPYISVACALPVNREPHLPLSVMPFAYAEDERSLRLYEGSRKVHDWLMRPLRQVLHEAARQLHVAPRDGVHEGLSPLAQISQTIAALDFPRRAAPAHLHHVGPLRPTLPEPCGGWPVDPLRPLVFASLGTLQGERLGMFRQMARACRQMNLQLLIAHCGALDKTREALLLDEGASWVTAFVAQRQVLQQADAVITHGGLNTVMDAIATQTPMLVMPIAFDQHGVAARVSYSGAGLQLNRRARAPRIAEALDALLARPLPRLAQLAAQLQQAGGTRRAADIVEQVLRSGRPVLAEATP